MEDLEVPPRPPDWEKRRFQLEDRRNVTRCASGAVGLAGSSSGRSGILGDLDHLGEFTRFVKRWEAIHQDTLSLLQEEFKALEIQRLQGESKRLEILQEHSQGQRRSIWPEDEQEQQEQEPGEIPACPGIFEQSEELVTSDFWKEKALRLNALLDESLQREDALYRQIELLRRSTVESPPVDEFHQMLHRADNFVHFTLRTAPVTISHQDKSLRYRFIYNHLPGIQQKDMIGKRDDEVYRGSGLAEADALRMEVIRRGLPAKREFVFSSPELGMKAVLMAIEPVFSVSGDVIGINVVAMDVTEEAEKREKQVQLREEAAVQRAMETELHKTIHIAEETMRAKQLLATMSHEIRSPLSGVVSMAEILSTTALDEEQRQLVEIMMTSGDLVLQLINDILNMSNVESDALKLDAKKFRPREVVKNVLQMAVASAQSKHLTLEGLVVDEVPSEVIGDVLRIRQILINLISNAIKFTPKGIVGVVMRAMPPTNRPKTHQKPDGTNNDTMWLHCEVFDTGIGIPESSIPTLFKRYVQASAAHARQYGGTGLGLAICKQLVELMGGELNVASKENEGSTFSFTLPCKITVMKVEEHEKQSAYFKFVPASGNDNINVVPYSQTFSSSKAASSPGLEGHTAAPVIPPFAADRKPKILLAEDDKVNVMVATSMLKRLGLKAEVVCNGEEAVKAVERSQFDLILMDICMPVMDGLEATRRIRELQQHGTSQRTPIIAMTANALAEDVAECYAHGMDFFVAKPATFKRLEHALKKFLSHMLES